MRRDSSNKIRVAELFAGVGGFRIGLDRAKNANFGFETIWSNQWEPATKRQHASEVYRNAFGIEGHSNQNIAKVSVSEIPNHDLLVGGFPCQDYSVARTLSQAAGLQGKKGVLWWEIHRILREKGPNAPRYLMLENVDRLLKSPSSQRGRDFAIMLASLSDLGYAIEWRVVNAADYGMPQRRRRIYILGYKENSGIYKESISTEPEEWIIKRGLFAKTFPVSSKGLFASNLKLEGGLDDISKRFNKLKGDSPFSNAGFMKNRNVWTIKSSPEYSGGVMTLRDVLLSENELPEGFFIDKATLSSWKYLKGAKKEKRKGKDGFTYNYTEGPIAFPDLLNKPSRTIVTGEGGSAPSRFKHVIQLDSGKYRRLTPIELERLNMFPDDHTKLEGISDVKRAFFMGNALVVGVVERLGKELLKRATSSPSSTTKASASIPLPAHHVPKVGKRASLAA